MVSVCVKFHAINFVIGRIYFIMCCIANSKSFYILLVDEPINDLIRLKLGYIEFVIAGVRHSTIVNLASWC